MVSMLTVMPCAASSLIDRHHPGGLDRGIDAGRAGAGRLAADVDDRRARGDQRQPVFDGTVTVEVSAAVGERVVGDVDDPHHLHARDRGRIGGLTCAG